MTDTQAQAAAATPWCWATSSTMSPMIRLTWKSFGVYTRATPAAEQRLLVGLAG